MATVREATERFFDAAKLSADAIAEATQALQERSLHLAETLINDAERWQKDQQSWLASTVDVLGRWPTYGIDVARALIQEAAAAQQQTRRLSAALAESARVAAEAGQELALSVNKLILSAMAAPLGSYAQQVEELRDRLADLGHKVEANTKAGA